MISKDVVSNNIRVLKETFHDSISCRLIEQIESYIQRIEDEKGVCKCDAICARQEADRLQTIINELKLQLAESRRDR